MDTSQKHCAEQKDPDILPPSVRFHFCEIPEHAKLIYGDSNQNTGCLRVFCGGGVQGDWERTEGNFLGRWKCPACLDSYMATLSKLIELCT